MKRQGSLPMEGFATACRRWESIDGELDHNDCYRPTKHHDGGLISVNGYIFCFFAKDAYSKIGSYIAIVSEQKMLWTSFVGTAKHGTMKNIKGSGCF